MTAVPSAQSSHGAGPGVGIRLNSSGWQPPKTTPLRLPAKNVIPDREAAKLDKFKTVLAGPNTDLGKGF